MLSLLRTMQDTLRHMVPRTCCATPAPACPLRAYKVKANTAVTSRFKKLAASRGYKFKLTGKNHNLGTKSPSQLRRASHTGLTNATHTENMKKLGYAS